DGVDPRRARDRRALRLGRDRARLRRRDDRPSRPREAALGDVSPMDSTRSLLEPFEPTAADPWDRAKAAHLLRRAGFGGTLVEIDAAIAAGPEAALRALAAGDECEAHRETLALGDVLASSGDLEALQAWWLLRCVRASRPLREKLALFWHGHFA